MKRLRNAMVVFLVLYCSSLAQIDTLVLPAPQRHGGKPLLETLLQRHSERNLDTATLPLQEISNILWAAYGINRPESGKRTAPSAMNVQNITLYVFLSSGVYKYEPLHHVLLKLQTSDERDKTGTQTFVREAPMNIVYVANIEKPSQISADLKLLWSAITTGCIVQNVYLYSASAGLGTVVRASFQEAELQKLLSLSSQEKIITTQTVGYPK